MQASSREFAATAVHSSDPAAVAREWVRYGFGRLHLVDIDAALGRGSNARQVREILAAEEAHVQVGGGARHEDAVERLIEDGASWVIIGASALDEGGWLEDLTSTYPGAVIVAANVRARRVVPRGRERRVPPLLTDVIDELNRLALGGVMVTAIDREGLLQGTDLPLMEDAAEESAHPIIASGGISTLMELRALAERGVSAAVVGMALYSGALDPRDVAEEFGE